MIGLFSLMYRFTANCPDPGIEGEAIDDKGEKSQNFCPRIVSSKRTIVFSTFILQFIIFAILSI